MEEPIDVKARERADSLLGEEKERLVTEYETKFEDYKKDITSKFSNFVDSVLDQELTIPEKVMEYARKGELYTDLVEQFKIRIGIDEGVLDEEAKALSRCNNSFTNPSLASAPILPIPSPDKWSNFLPSKIDQTFNNLPHIRNK